MIKNYLIIGLGNPGEEYVETRHNVGRRVLDAFVKKNNWSAWEENKKLKALMIEGKIEKNKALLLKPETFMNKSGEAVKSLITSKKKAETLVVIHDDLDLPLGKIKISFNKSSGGHKGVESIMKAVKTEAFIRLRLGISAETASGKIKKPQGEEKVIDTILGDFKKTETDELKKVIKKAVVALELIIVEGREKATSMLGTL
ncbi:MAG: aminoacyl-tRNA hydrolase [Candidatus Taylorbacteria bacterium RIFOXYD2_FULL_36_9]|uniref:Peptidyl-tRNA hydrolase n=1 Tax=Candidatus Taylorbacteria bacterium RIFOXYD2_FULL_36_9 TaxID=1802338 RepID=A0A1G2PHX2_9BACT|nr:MAG: aminoacyl-tRNA hydrolase [Candidatus Taylorbacteria bacterium RIFOXYD2_FULL_36_9]